MCFAVSVLHEFNHWTVIAMETKVSKMKKSTHKSMAVKIIFSGVILTTLSLSLHKSAMRQEDGL